MSRYFVHLLTSFSLLSPIPSPHLPSRPQAPSLLLPTNRRSPRTRPTSTASHSNAIARHAKTLQIRNLKRCHVRHTTANPFDILVSSSRHIVPPSAPSKHRPSTSIHVLFSATY